MFSIYSIALRNCSSSYNSSYTASGVSMFVERRLFIKSLALSPNVILMTLVNDVLNAFMIYEGLLKILASLSLLSLILLTMSTLIKREGTDDEDADSAFGG
jgi:hypothetical protein